MRLKDVNPTMRCSFARRSWPKARSRNGTRAIRRTWASSRSAATRPVSRPAERRAVVPLVSCWIPPPVAHQKATSSRLAHSTTFATVRRVASSRALPGLERDGTGGAYADGRDMVSVTKTLRRALRRRPWAEVRCRHSRTPGDWWSRGWAAVAPGPRSVAHLPSERRRNHPGHRGRAGPRRPRRQGERRASWAAWLLRTGGLPEEATRDWGPRGTARPRQQTVAPTESHWGPWDH